VLRLLLTTGVAAASEEGLPEADTLVVAAEVIRPAAVMPLAADTAVGIVDRSSIDA